jgi:hypothetical protein
MLITALTTLVNFIYTAHFLHRADSMCFTLKVHKIEDSKESIKPHENRVEKNA